MTEHQTERDVRIEKARAYQRAFGEVYPSKSHRTNTTEEFLNQFSSGHQSTVTGRIRQWREHGKLTFAHIEDASGRLQIALSHDALENPSYDQLSLFDVGDIVEVSGTPFTTQSGEKTLKVSSIIMLAKALRPIPDEWFGLQDEEQRYRHRYLDLLLRPEMKAMFLQKATFWHTMRSFLLKEGFLEVETPVLEITAGGADAHPFTTHHEALGVDLYLRISTGELWQKRLMVAGFEKTFEIGRQFRNEGISSEHLQDYTQVEFYWAYANYEDTMALVERMYKTVILQTFLTLQFHIHEFDVNLDQPWPRIDFTNTIQEQLHINVREATDDELQAVCQKLNLTYDAHASRGRLIDILWKHCRKTIKGPAFVIDHPVDVSPLAKRHRDRIDLVERYQVIIAGSELGNGYTELNNPIDQAERFQKQARLRAAGDKEAQAADHDFVEALEYGMPPTSGFGMSERLFSFLVDKPIRECVLFPLLRPQSGQHVDSRTQDSSDVTLKPFSAGISRKQAWEWLQERVKDENLRRHMLATEVLMERLARHFNAAAPEAWGIAGLLHDIDWEQTTAETHSLVGAKWLEERGIHSAIVSAVREHNNKHNMKPTTMLSKALYSLEQLTGLVIAAVLVRPKRDISGLTVASLKKKFKDRAFAAGADRALIQQSETLLNISLEQALKLCLEAMQTKAKELGFN